MANLVKKDGNQNRAVARRQDPFQMMRDLLVDPFRMFHQMAPWSTEQPTWNPSFEVRETDDAYLFKADLPGLKPEDVDISLVENRLEICGAREQEAEREEGTWHTYERSYGSFSRAFALPDNAELDKISSDLKDGVLTLVVPKKAQAEQQRRKVQVSSGSKS